MDFQKRRFPVLFKLDGPFDGFLMTMDDLSRVTPAFKLGSVSVCITLAKRFEFFLGNSYLVD